MVFPMSQPGRNEPKNDNILTVQVYQNHLNPRTFKVPFRWITGASVFAWILFALTLISSFYAAKLHFSEKSSRPALVDELENEVQQLKIALEKKGDTTLNNNAANQPLSTGKSDPLASDEKPAPGPGTTLEGKEGTWGGLAEGISAPTGAAETIKLEDTRLDWQGKFANFTAGVLFREPGKGSQQGHIVVLARGPKQIAAHPDNVLNTSSGDHLFQPARGEYFSVSRFRPLKTHLGPFESQSELSEVQVYVFDLNNTLILLRTYKYGK